VKRRDGKVSGFLLLPAGRDHHATLLDDDRAAARCDEVVEAAYAAFLVHNETFKQLCTDWQLGPGDPVVIAGRLTAFHPEVAGVIDEPAGAMARFRAVRAPVRAMPPNASPAVTRRRWPCR
jgi:hypothetical protein